MRRIHGNIVLSIVCSHNAHALVIRSTQKFKKKRKWKRKNNAGRLIFLKHQHILKKSSFDYLFKITTLKVTKCKHTIRKQAPSRTALIRISKSGENEISKRSLSVNFFRAIHPVNCISICPTVFPSFVI